MTARNDITGDAIQTKGSTDAYRTGWDRIFKAAPPPPAPEPAPPPPAPVETPPPPPEPAPSDDLRAQWWEHCQTNQSRLTTPLPSGNLIPTFDEWRNLAGL